MSASSAHRRCSDELAAAAILVACGLAGCADRDASPDASAAADTAAVPTVAVPPDAAANPEEARLAEGARLYAKYCLLCHGAEGKGYAADNAPSLVSSTWLATADDAFFRASIALGRPGTAMAPYGRSRGGPMSELDIVKVVAFLRARAPVPLTRPDPPGAGDAARGEVQYRAICASCHGDREKRGTAPQLANAVFLSLASDAFIRHAIVHGRPETKMDAWGGKLTGQQVDDVVALLRSWAPSPAAVTAPNTPPPPPPSDGPVVVNPGGRRPRFTLREERFVSVEEVKRALDEKRRMVLIDARPASEWIRGHIPGAVSMPYYQLDRIKDLPRDGTWIIAYCACPHHASGVIVDELRKAGFKKTAILDEGILVWQQKKYPIKSATPPAASGRQAVAPPGRVAPAPSR